MSIWPAVRDEVKGAWRSVKYDLRRRGVDDADDEPDYARYDAFAGGPRRVMVSAGVAALILGGAVGSYLGIVNGLGALLEREPVRASGALSASDERDAQTPTTSPTPGSGSGWVPPAGRYGGGLPDGVAPNGAAPGAPAAGLPQVTGAPIQPGASVVPPGPTGPDGADPGVPGTGGGVPVPPPPPVPMPAPTDEHPEPTPSDESPYPWPSDPEPRPSEPEDSEPPAEPDGPESGGAPYDPTESDTASYDPTSPDPAPYDPTWHGPASYDPTWHDPTS